MDKMKEKQNQRQWMVSGHACKRGKNKILLIVSLDLELMKVGFGNE